VKIRERKEEKKKKKGRKQPNHRAKKETLFSRERTQDRGGTASPSPGFYLFWYGAGSEPASSGITIWCCRIVAQLQLHHRGKGIGDGKSNYLTYIGQEGSKIPNLPSTPAFAE
jgi:ribosomal protein S8E